MTAFTATLANQWAKQADKLKQDGRLRTLTPARGIDFTSNDYLGLSTHPALRDAAINALHDHLAMGSGGSRLLRGNHPAHEMVEQKAAEFFGTPRSLFFANGYMAGLAVMTALPDTHDVILFDALIHASLRDGIQANPARHIRIAHNDLNAYADALKDTNGKRAWVVVESVYSMDGDLAPLHDLAKLCAEHHAVLVVDEAHATGVFGHKGKGLVHGLHTPDLITIHTCGKALGVAGALVCADDAVIELLINKARSFIYSTAPMPLQAILVTKALELCAGADDRRMRLQEVCDLARRFLPASPSPIIPYILGEDAKAVEVAAALQAKGFDIRAIRPPTVPAGTARLRITLNAALKDEDITSLGAALQDIV